MTVQKRRGLFSAFVLLLCLMESPGPAFTVTFLETPAIIPQSFEAFPGFGGNSCLHPVPDDENGIFMVYP